MSVPFSGAQAARLSRALAAIDAANTGDPEWEEVGGARQPKALLYGQRMSAWLARLWPEASEALRIAARAQHLCRWRLPRDSYPPDRQGYKAWRVACAEMHARLAAEILSALGYPEALIERVGALLQKQKLKVDAEVQTLEDAACLVFLEHHLDEFARGREDHQLVHILQRTWKKMSAQGHEEALRLALSEPVRALLRRALEG
jgi:hypothetical protein